VWLRRLAPVAQPWVRLVCFPHSGGSASYYRPWRACLPSDVELYGVQYPGRLDRIGERCAADVDELADALAAAVRPLLDRPTALFGHSLGATVAFEVARRLPNIAQLFVSRRSRPHRQKPGPLHLATDGEIRAVLGRSGDHRPVNH
jgi:pyochelin biosynthetic protein PchC